MLLQHLASLVKVVHIHTDNGNVLWDLYICAAEFIDDNAYQILDLNDSILTAISHLKSVLTTHSISYQRHYVKYICHISRIRSRACSSACNPASFASYSACFLFLPEPFTEPRLRQRKTPSIPLYRSSILQSETVSLFQYKET
jgi:hypothetical protein